jgi:hypothetical protein
MKKFTHSVCYFALAGAYAATLAGVDKGVVTALTALLYLLLAMDELTGGTH